MRARGIIQSTGWGEERESDGERETELSGEKVRCFETIEWHDSFRMQQSQ